MRITVDIDDNVLREVQRATGLRKKSPAINKAIAEYLRQQAIGRIVHLVREGKVDYSTSNDQIEAREE